MLRLHLAPAAGKEGAAVTYEDFDGVVVDTETGEIVQSAGINDPMGHVAGARVAAKEQEKLWEERRRNLDRVLLRGMTVGERTAYGDIVVSCRRSPDVSHTDGERFADELNARPLELDDLWQVIIAARAFDPKRLPERAREAYAAATTVKAGTDWADVRRVLRPAPARVVVDMEAEA